MFSVIRGGQGVSRPGQFLAQTHRRRRRRSPPFDLAGSRKFHFGVDEWSDNTAKEIETKWKGCKIQDQIKNVK